MKQIMLLSLLLIAGCTTVPIERKFPDAPEKLLKRCPDLKQTDLTDKLSTAVDVIAENYGSYHKCQNKNDGWIEWFYEQKEIFESVGG